MEGYGRPPSGVMRIVVLVVGFALALVALYCIFFRPETYVDVLTSIENREGYARETAEARRETEEMRGRLAQLEAQLADSDTFAQSLHDDMLAMEEEKGGLLARIGELEAAASGSAEAEAEATMAMQALEAEKGKLEQELAGFEEGVRKRWHLSFGGVASNPITFNAKDFEFKPTITLLAGAGPRRWQVLAGVGYGMEQGMTLSLGFMWTFGDIGLWEVK